MSSNRCVNDAKMWGSGVQQQCGISGTRDRWDLKERKSSDPPTPLVFSAACEERDEGGLRRSIGGHHPIEETGRERGRNPASDVDVGVDTPSAEQT